MNNAAFCLAGIQFSLEAEDDVPPICLPPEYGPFVSLINGLSAPNSRYKVAPPGYEYDSLFDVPSLWQNDLWRLGQATNHRLFVEVFDKMTSRWHRRAAISDDFSSGTLYSPPIAPDASSIMPLPHPLDQPLIQGRLAHLRGGVVHSSCVVADGRALLFVGRSGAGKTTMARIWRQAGATIVNDERNIIRLENGAVLAGSSPWHGEENHVSTVCAPLAAVFYIHQTPGNRLNEVTSEASLPRLFTTTFVPVFLQDGPAMVLDAWGGILEKVPSYDLGFVPDGSIVPFCLAAISGR